MKKSFKKILYQSGLTEKQALVYEYLLRNGPSVPTLVSEETNITRPSVYRVLLELSIKGLIHEIQEGKKKTFFINSIDDLVRWKKDNIKYVKRQSDLIEKNALDFKSVLDSNKNTIQVRYFNNIDALYKIYEDHLLVSNYEMIGFSDIQNIQEFLGKEYLKKYIQSKKYKNISSRGIIPNNNFGEKYLKNFYGDYTYNEQVQIRLMDQEKFPIGKGTEIILYGDGKISLIDVGQKTLSGVIIENKSLHQTLKSVFEMTWLQLKD